MPHQKNHVADVSEAISALLSVSERQGETARFGAWLPPAEHDLQGITPVPAMPAAGADLLGSGEHLQPILPVPPARVTRSAQPFAGEEWPQVMPGTARQACGCAVNAEHRSSCPAINSLTNLTAIADRLALHAQSRPNPYGPPLAADLAGLRLFAATCGDDLLVDAAEQVQRRLGDIPATAPAQAITPWQSQMAASLSGGDHAPALLRVRRQLMSRAHSLLLLR